MEIKEQLLPSLKTANLQKIAWSSLKIGEIIGEGGYGVVSQGQWCDSVVAIKQLHLKALAGALLAEFEHETQIMAQCRFPYIVHLYGVCMEIGHMAMVMEYLSKGSLYQVLHDPKEPLPWNPLRWEIALDIGRGLHYLHSQKIIHRDLKSLNVLLNEQYQAKIGDFGLAKIKLTSGSTSTKSTKGMGTTRWRAPELFSLEDDVPSPNQRTDAYSYGMVLWEIASRMIPFKNAPDDMMAGLWIMQGKKEKIPQDCPSSYAQIIAQCWDVPEKRPTAEMLISLLMAAKPQKVEHIVQPYVEKSWHFDPEAFKAKRHGQEVTHVLIEATDKDKCKVLEFYQYHPMPGYDIASVQVIYNAGMNHKFELYINELQQRDNNPAFKAKWPMGRESNYELIESQENVAWRTQIHQKCIQLAKPYQDSDYPAVNLLPMWHGTKKSIVESIFKTGYAALATTDSGYFGKGVYSTYEAEYAYRVYAKEGGALILNWTACFSAYPVIDGDMKKFVFKNEQGQDVSIGNYSNYDAHFVPVVPYDPDNPNHINPSQDSYYPTKPNEKHKYTELVVFQSAACLPRYLVTLQPSLQKPIDINSSGKSVYQVGKQLLLAGQHLKALPYFEESAQKGYPPAYLALGFLHQVEGLIGSKDEKKSQYYYQQVKNTIEWFQAQASTGTADAQNNLGFCYYKGIGVARDVFQAAKYYQLAADQGEISAQNNLALCYKQGEGVQKDDTRVVHYYRLAASQGNATAQYNLGWCYQQGRGVEADMLQAFHCFTLAANQGNANAQYAVGCCYQTGQGVSKNEELACDYFRRAAEKGHVSEATYLPSFSKAKKSQPATSIYSLNIEDNTSVKKENCLIM